MLRRDGDTAQYSTARAKLKRGIKGAKAAYKQRIENHFSCRTSNFTAVHGEAVPTKAPEAASPKPPALSRHSLTVEEHDVRPTFMCITQKIKKIKNVN